MMQVGGVLVSVNGDKEGASATLVMKFGNDVKPSRLLRPPTAWACHSERPTMSVLLRRMRFRDVSFIFPSRVKCPTTYIFFTSESGNTVPGTQYRVYRVGENA